MRVCELASKMKISLKEVLKRADALDIEAYNSLSKISDADAARIENSIGKRTVDQIRGGIAERDALFAKKRAAARANASGSDAALKDALKGHLAKAKAAVEAAKVKKSEPKPAPKAEEPKPAPKPVEVAPAPAPEPPKVEETKVEEKPAPKAPVKPARRYEDDDDDLSPEDELAASFLDRINRKDAQHGRDAKPARAQAKGERENRDNSARETRERERKREEERSRGPQQVMGYQPNLRQGPQTRAPYGQQGQRTPYGQQRTPYGQQGQKPGYGNRPGYGQQRTPYGQQGQRPGAGNRPGYGQQSGQRQGYGQRNDFNNRDRNARGGQQQRGGRTGAPVSGKPSAANTPAATPAIPISPDKIIMLQGAVVVKDLAEKLGLRPNRLIADLMQLNILASINQRVEVEVAQKIAAKYGYGIEIERQKRSTERKPVLRSEDADDDIPEDKPEDLRPRSPVVTFLGHVDHGKTSLMDRIRKTHVASGEAGGITQAISAYSVDVNGRKITFLDTPGHAAFSAMRMRGATMTDIAVIIIAADDGVMPQTKEAIADARQAGVQIMVAINKCDLPAAKPDRVRQMLQAENLTPEEWGGDIICCEVSAHTGAGVEHLLEMILLQADMLELQANPDRRADGYVIEAKMEHGLGPTAAVLVSGGTLKVGDIVLCGQYFGKVKALIDDRGIRTKAVGPAMAAKLTGLSGVPEAGAAFRVMLDEKRARELAEKAAEEHKLQVLANNAKATSLDDLMNKMKAGEKRELSCIVKADTQGSAEAIVEALRAITSQKVSLDIIYSGIGNVCETDVNNANAGKAIIVGFNVGCESGVQQKARHDSVRINTFRIIYELIDHVKNCMLDLLPPEYKEVVKGHAAIKAVFDIGKLGRVAGCQLEDGLLRAKARFRIFRGKEKLWEGKVSSLKHFQNEVAEITGSQECGIHFAGCESFQAGDTVECYELEELPRTL